MPARWGYFDTSVLVKRYVREKGSSQANTLMGQHRFLSSALAPAEAISALCRRRAAGELADRNFTAILERLRKDREHWELVEVSPIVLDQAEKLILSIPLRTLDALHVASALTFQAASGIRIPFITADAQQRDVAERMSLGVVWVE